MGVEDDASNALLKQRVWERKGQIYTAHHMATFPSNSHRRPIKDSRPF